MELEVHPIQSDILLVLLHKPDARFSQLNISKLPTDHFTFHLKRLQELQLVEKTNDDKYRLTTKGKEFANRFDTENAVLERQAKIGVLVGAAKRVDGEEKFLLQKRLKHPYFGFHGFITGKVRWGEELKQTVLRELKEETGLTGKPIACGVKHKLDYSMDGSLLEDKFFFVYRVEEPKGKLVEKFEGGENKWLTEKEIFENGELFSDVGETLKMFKARKYKLLEKKYTMKKY